MIWNRIALVAILLGYVLSGAVGGDVGAQQRETSITTSTTAPHEDCLPYDPASLRIEPEEGGTWLLTDGRSRMAMFDSQLDGTNGLAVALTHSAQCFIGRRPDRLRGVEVINYWSGTSTITPLVAPENCVFYTASSLHAVDTGANGWLVTDGSAFELHVTDAHDAAILLSVAQRFSAHCTISSASHRGFPHNQQSFHYFR